MLIEDVNNLLIEIDIFYLNHVLFTFCRGHRINCSCL